jgi:hypothetical protein
VYALPEDPGLVAKVYHRPSGERTRKLEIMVAHPPDDPMAEKNHRTFAWPVDLLADDRLGGKVVRFLMGRVTGMRPIFDFYNPASRRTLPLPRSPPSIASRSTTSGNRVGFLGRRRHRLRRRAEPALLPTGPHRLPCVRLAAVDARPFMAIVLVDILASSMR